MRGLRIAGAILATLLFSALALVLLIFVVIYVIALFQGDSNTAPWIFAAAAIVFLALSALAVMVARLCARRCIRLVQS